GLEDVHGVIYDYQDAGLTCVLINKGIIKSMPKPPKIGLIAHLSASTVLGPSPNRKVLIGSVAEVIRLGADAVSIHLNIGSKEEPEMLQKLGIVSDQCDEWSVPLIAMMYPRGENIKNPHDPGIVAHAARIGAEAGADMVKTVYTGDIDSFRQVVKSCPVPIVIAGGPKATSDSEIMQLCYDAMEAGAKGITFGRNIFQHKDPFMIIRLLAEIVISGKTPEEAKMISAYK
ncbi:MAG: 2-amino-3,7-dideoxy-D-threo-hept-6-ulosonate synthase, partial [Nitrososphaeraceae archaeon]